MIFCVIQPQERSQVRHPPCGQVINSSKPSEMFNDSLFRRQTEHETKTTSEERIRRHAGGARPGSRASVSKTTDSRATNQATLDPRSATRSANEMLLCHGCWGSFCSEGTALTSWCMSGQLLQACNTPARAKTTLDQVKVEASCFCLLWDDPTKLHKLCLAADSIHASSRASCSEDRYMPGYATCTVI